MCRSALLIVAHCISIISGAMRPSLNDEIESVHRSVDIICRGYSSVISQMELDTTIIIIVGKF